MADATPAVCPLRRRMIDDMTLRNLSPATQRSYLHAVTKFSRYFNYSPDRLGLEDVRAFQACLVLQGISWPVLNQTVCALRFDTESGRGPRTDCLFTHTAQAADDPERRRDRAFPRDGAIPEDTRGPDNRPLALECWCSLRGCVVWDDGRYAIGQNFLNA